MTLRQQHWQETQTRLASLEKGQRKLFGQIDDLNGLTTRADFTRTKSTIVSVWFQCGFCTRRSNPSAGKISTGDAVMHALCPHCGALMEVQI